MSANEPMTQERLGAIRARADGATSGPWGCYGDGAHEVFNAGEYSDGDPGEVVAAVIDKLSDAVFIAEAREDIPALLAEVERLRARLTVDDDMVERVARELADLETGEGWPSNHDLGGGPCGTRDDEFRDAMRERAREVLAAALGTGEES